MSDILLCSAAFGGLDKVQHIPAHSPRIYTHMHTDQKDMFAWVRDSWSEVSNPDWPRKDLNLRLRSQYFKQQIHRHPLAPSCRWLVWMDASIALQKCQFIVDWAETLSQQPAEKRALFMPHNQRATIAQEADFIYAQLKIGNEYICSRYTAQATQAQMGWLLGNGYRADAPLYLGGFWMIENSYAAWDLLNAWWDQTLRFGDGAIDQLALGALLAQRFDPTPFNVTVFDNPFFRFIAHR